MGVPAEKAARQRRLRKVMNLNEDMVMKVCSKKDFDVILRR